MIDAGGLDKTPAFAVAAAALQSARDTLLLAVPGAVAAAEAGSAFLDPDQAGSHFYGAVLSGIEQALYAALLAEGYTAGDAAQVAAKAAPDAASRASGLVQGAVEASRAAAEATTVARRYYVGDHLGSVRAVVNAFGHVIEARDYYPFGLQMPGRVYVQGSETREGYTGHELDAETGHYYAGARYYMPALGRWTAVDPLAGDFPAWSPYNYAFNNPLSYNDPDGKSPCLFAPNACAAALGAAVGAGLDYAVQVGVNYAQGNENPWTDIDSGSIATSAAAGGAGAGLISKFNQVVGFLRGGSTAAKATQVGGEAAIDATVSAGQQLATTGEVDPSTTAAGVFAGGLRTLGGSDIQRSSVMIEAT